MIGRLAAALAAAALCGCDLAPAYKAPVVAVPVTYKEASKEPGQWEPARPADDTPRGAWWAIYANPVLDGLEQRIDGDSPDLAAALASLSQARAFAREAEAGLYPTLSIGAAIATDRQSNRRPRRGQGQPNQYMDNTISVQANYEVDLWGKVANAIKSGKAAAAASAADLETTRLSLHAEMAADYLDLRGLDGQAALLAQTVSAYGRALQLVRNRLAGKIGSDLDVSRAQTELSQARAQADDIAARRALLEHAIAVLAGEPPSALTIPPDPTPLAVPVVSAGLPSTLLERRPDIAAAERLVAAANAQIGIARAAFYPTLSLNLLYGLEDSGFNIFSLPNDMWSIGPGLALPLFEGGLRRAEEAATVAAHDLAVAQYKQTVLSAFQDVEDNLSLLRDLGQEERSEDAAVAAAKQTVKTSLALFTDGATNYLEVVTAQEAALQAQQTAIALHARRLDASVGLIRGLGGGWDRRDLMAEAR